MITARTIEIDRGWAGVESALRRLDGARTKVGLPANGHTSGRYSMAKLAKVAYFNEFGIEVPERSFIRSATDANRDEVFREAKLAVGRIMFEAAKTPLAQLSVIRHFVSGVGQFLANRIKKKIQDGPFQELSTRTITKKGHDMPLVETGQLFETIQERTLLRGGSGE